MMLRTPFGRYVPTPFQRYSDGVRTPFGRVCAHTPLTPPVPSVPVGTPSGWNLRGDTNPTGPLRQANRTADDKEKTRLRMRFRVNFFDRRPSSRHSNRQPVTIASRRLVGGFLRLSLIFFKVLVRERPTTYFSTYKTVCQLRRRSS